MKKSKSDTFCVDKNLQKEVLDILDSLYSYFMMNRNSKNIALEIVKGIRNEYGNQNCFLFEVFGGFVIPYLKKLDENTRLELVKGLLTDGYIEIEGHRVDMLYLPYLNYKPK